MHHSQLQFRLFVEKVLTNVPDDHSLFRDEVFGPVTAITKFSTESEVIRDKRFKYAVWRNEAIRSWTRVWSRFGRIFY